MAIAIALTGVGSAEAGPFDVFGFGSRSIALGGSATAFVDDYTAVFHNPANLVLRKNIHLGAEFLSAIPNLEINLEPGAEVAPIDPDGFFGVGLGLLFPVGGKIDYRLAFGLVLYLPTSDLLRVDALDPLIPRWYLWDSLADKLQISFGFAGEITDWLRVGFAAQSLANVSGTAEIELEVLNEQILRRDVYVEIVNTVAPIAGLHVGPFYGMTFGFSWRSELLLQFDLPINISLGDALNAQTISAGDALYTPHTFNFGVAWDMPEHPWMFAFDARYHLWSGAPDPALLFALDVGGDLVEGIGAGDLIDLRPGPSGLPGFTDIWSWHLGAETWVNDNIVARVGYQFRPTPIPAQAGLTNYVDNRAHTLSAGFGLEYPDPLNLDEFPVTFEMTGSYHLLGDVETVKESENDPVGSYNHGGQIFSLSVTLRHDF